MTAPMRFLVQPGHNTQAGYAAYMSGPVVFSDLHKVVSAQEGLVPIGSVEFCRKYASSQGFKPPAWDPYPRPLRRFMARRPMSGRFGDVPDDMFVKPLATKAFDAGIKSSIEEPVHPLEAVYFCEAVTFTAEWRVYVCDGQRVAVTQYGEGDDAEPDLQAIDKMLAAWKGPAGWSLDVGLVDGRTHMVETNDGWALGMYQGIARDDYLRLVEVRWREIEQLRRAR